MNNPNNNPKTKLELTNVYVSFVNTEDNSKYGKSITVLAYSEVAGHVECDVIDEITKWVEENNIGSGDDAGKPHFKHYEKEYEVYDYFYFKPGRDTVYSNKDGQTLSLNDIKPNSTICLTARAFPYSYKDENGKTIQGVSHRLSSVFVMEAGESQAQEDAKELYEKIMATNTESKEDNLGDIPF